MHKHNLNCRCAMPYPLADVEAGVWAIAQDGAAIVLGDSSSIRLIYNNLTGNDYQARGSYEKYLAYMSRECRVTIKPDALELVEGVN